jgi:hypothetical protein
MAGRADELLCAARQYLRMGASVIPIGMDKYPNYRALRASGNLNWAGLPCWKIFTTRQASENELQSWCASGTTNIGFVTSFNGLFVLDFDVPEVFHAWWARHPHHTQTWVQRTHRGYHAFFRCEQRLRMSRMYFDGTFGGDLIGGLRWMSCPPSIHLEGSCYQWLDRHSPSDIPLLQVSSVSELGVEQREFRAIWRRSKSFYQWFRRRPRKAIRKFIDNRLRFLGR